MRVLLSTIGSRGDVQPLVALASQLRAQGQEVHLCVPPDFRQWIAGLGMRVTPIGPELRTATASRSSGTDGPSPEERRRQAVDATVATQFETIGAAAQGCDVIVGATALQIAAPSVAEKMGIPYVFVSYCPVVLPSLLHAPPPLSVPGQLPAPATADKRELWAQNAERVQNTFGPALNLHRASLGLAPVRDVRSHIFTDHPWLAADPALAPWPDPADQSVVQTGAWLLPDDRPLSPELETFLNAGEPPVYFGFGSMRVPQTFGQVMIDAARALGRRAIVSRGWADLSAIDNEPDCLTVGEVNLRALFKRVAAAVHHGGAGTTTLAALAGAPQVIVPLIYDQHYWAQRVHEIGIGTAHAPGVPATDSLTQALERTLQPDVATRSRSIAAAMRTDGVQLAAERLMAGHLRN
ncbi:MAG TPA: glycosyltransferase [Vicinamibacterales bacterium]|nr:glycosyltransferase [Vicinamibacterales bacterium]